MEGKWGSVFRNIYKGHIDKTKVGESNLGSGYGWGEGKWWEENGDNCT